MKPLKKALKNTAVQYSLCWLASLYIRFVYLTSRKTVKGEKTVKAILSEGKPIILAFWHGRLLLMPKVWHFRDKDVHVLISDHIDGSLIARVIRFFGLHSIRGSTNQNAASALRRIFKHIKLGDIVAITPDGPRGPRMRVNGAIMSIAQKTGATIIPLVFSASKGKILSSWDCFMLAYPFARLSIVYGDGITIDEHADATVIRSKEQYLEEQMNRLVRESDISLGRDPVEPA